MSNAGPEPPIQPSTPAPAAPVSPGAVLPQAAGRFGGRGVEVMIVAVSAVVGALLGVAWWGLRVPATRFSDDGEAAASGDVVFILLAVVAAVLTLITLWPQRQQLGVFRFVVTLFAAALGSGVGVGVGTMLGMSRPDTWAVLVVWPLIVSLGTALSAIVFSFRAQAP